MVEIKVRRFEQVRDVLAYAIGVHERLKSWVEQARRHRQEKTVALLPVGQYRSTAGPGGEAPSPPFPDLDYLAEREQKLIQALGAYLRELEEQDPKILEVWLPYPHPWHEMLLRIAELKPRT